MTKRYSVVVMAMREEDDGRLVSLGNAQIDFKTIQELIKWSDDCGVDYTK